MIIRPTHAQTLTAQPIDRAEIFMHPRTPLQSDERLAIRC